MPAWEIGPTADGIVIGSGTFLLLAAGSIATDPIGPSSQGHRSELSAGISIESDLVNIGPVCGPYDPELASALGADLA